MTGKSKNHSIIPVLRHPRPTVMRLLDAASNFIAANLDELEITPGTFNYLTIRWENNSFILYEIDDFGLPIEYATQHRFERFFEPVEIIQYYRQLLNFLQTAENTPSNINTFYEIIGRIEYYHGIYILSTKCGELLNMQTNLIDQVRIYFQTLIARYEHISELFD